MYLCACKQSSIKISDTTPTYLVWQLEHLRRTKTYTGIYLFKIRRLITSWCLHNISSYEFHDHIRPEELNLLQVLLTKFLDES